MDSPFQGGHWRTCRDPTRHEGLASVWYWIVRALNTFQEGGTGWGRDICEIRRQWQRTGCTCWGRKRENRFGTLWEPTGANHTSRNVLDVNTNLQNLRMVLLGNVKRQRSNREIKTLCKILKINSSKKVLFLSFSSVEIWVGSVAQDVIPGLLKCSYPHLFKWVGHDSLIAKFFVWILCRLPLQLKDNLNPETNSSVRDCTCSFLCPFPKASPRRMTDQSLGI